jgi:AcrR family transcriptional regulator
VSRGDLIFDQRTTILAAAIDILHERGAGALTVRSVASSAGCSTTGVYTWFGGKNGLVEAIFVDGFERFGLALIQARDDASTESALGALAAAYRAWALANPTHYMVMFGRAVPDFEPGQDALAQARSTFTLLVQATAETMHRLGVEGSAEGLAHHLWAGIHGYVSLELADMDMTTDAAERQRRFDEGLRLLFRGCLGAA